MARMPEPHKATLKDTLLADATAALARRPDLRWPLPERMAEPDHAERVQEVGDACQVAGRSTESEPPDDRLRVVLRVLQPGIRIRGKIGVIGPEEFIRAGVVFCLNQPAIAAHHHPKRIPFFRCMQIRGV